MSSKHKNTRGKTFALLAIVGACFAILVVGILRIYQSYAIGAWPRSEATINRVEIKKSRPPPFQRYEPILSYEFQVGDKTFIGDKIGVIGISSNYEDELEWLKKTYSVGSVHTVYYQADCPTVAYLQYGPRTLDYLIFIVPSSIICAWLWDVAVGIRCRIDG